MKLKDLLENATTQLRDLSPLENPDFRLEQAVFNKEENVWEIVVSYLVENNNRISSPIAPLALQSPFQRIYKKAIMERVFNKVCQFRI